VGAASHFINNHNALGRSYTCVFKFILLFAARYIGQCVQWALQDGRPHTCQHAASYSNIHVLLQQFETDISQPMIGLNPPMWIPGGRDVIRVVAMVTPMPRWRNVAGGGVVVVVVGARRCSGCFVLAVLVGLDVLAEMVGAHESFRADRADESFLARVRPNVPL